MAEKQVVHKLYVVVNDLNGKVYVGQTSQKYLSERWKKHLFCARRGVDTFFYNAIRKYGPTAFRTTLLNTATTREEISRLEKLLILVLRANEKEYGYNTTLGGDGARHTAETRAKISRIQLGRKPSEKALANHRAAMADPEYRRKRSQISKEMWERGCFKDRWIKRRAKAAVIRG